MVLFAGVKIGGDKKARAAPVCMLAAWLLVVAPSGELSIVCDWSGAKQGLAQFQCLFLCSLRRETGVEAIPRNRFCHWSGATQWSARFRFLFLCLV